MFMLEIDGLSEQSLHRALSGGRLGDVRVNGILRCNGTGAIRVEVNAVANGDRGEVVERCQARTRITLRRGGMRR